MFIETEEHTKATCLSKPKRNPKRSLTLENLFYYSSNCVQNCKECQRKLLIRPHRLALVTLI